MADTSRAPGREGAPGLTDDFILPFRTERSRLLGRVVRLGSVVDTVLSHHDNPEPISAVLGEALALAALLGSGMKPDSRLTLQTRGDGPIRFLVVNYEKPGRMRGYVSVDGDRWQARNVAEKAPEEGQLLGSGHLALTIDPGGELKNYQGIVAFDQGTLSEAARTYFRQSEQLPTFLRLAVARVYTAGEAGNPGRWSWRAGGLLIQSLVAEQTASDDLDQADADEDWQRVCHLAGTLEDHELLDPTLSSERLLYRLFHEEGVRVSPVEPVAEYCRCSQERVEALVASFGPEEVEDMRDAEGIIAVTCEFCNSRYVLSAPSGVTAGTASNDGAAKPTVG